MICDGCTNKEDKECYGKPTGETTCSGFLNVPFGFHPDAVETTRPFPQYTNKEMMKLEIAIEAKYNDLEILQQQHIRLTGQRHRWFR